LHVLHVSHKLWIKLIANMLAVESVYVLAELVCLCCADARAKQQDAIVLAFRLGYFDTPRKVSVGELAQKLGLASSTLAVHLRRAERRLLAEILNESLNLQQIMQ